MNAADSGGGSKQWLNTRYFTPTANKISECIKTFVTEKDNVYKYLKAAKEDWKGTGRQQFDLNSEKLMRQLSDIQDELYDIRDSIVEAEATYIEADNAVAKSLVQ